VTEQLGNDEFQRIFARGRSLDFEAAMDLALTAYSAQDLVDPGGDHELNGAR
jgi:hypothetical protein